MEFSQPQFSLLLVDDEPAVLSTLKRVFFEDDYKIFTAISGEEALSMIQETKINAALIDLKMPGMDGLTLLKKVKELYPDIMVIMLTGHGGIQDAVEAIKLGATDFLEKPFSSEGLRARISQLHQIWKLKEENRNLKRQTEFQFGFDRLVGNSTPILRLKQMVLQAGSADVPVLIQGETGTGKELVAKAIHHHSPRSESSFVPVDCAAISENVMESELFGHVKGAFTGAHVSTLGLIRSADRGSLFLDEIGELSPAIQAKLLRTIQEKEVRPVGSSQTHVVDVRIIAATNQDLSQEVSRGTFREDLLYRLNVLTLDVPPLRERKKDIPLLARHFIKRFGTEFSPVKGISEEALVSLDNYSWPGNVRELENVIRRAMALGKVEIILPENLPDSIYVHPDKPGETVGPNHIESLETLERRAIRNALLRSQDNRKRAAEMLGIGEATLYRKIKKYRLTD